MDLLTRRFALALGAAAVAALGFAFVLEHGFGYEPCNLCIWERWPWVAVAATGIGGVLMRRPQLGLALALLALAANAGLSAYHVGVEQGVFALPAGCTTGVEARTVEELKALLAAAPPRCDQVSASWLGLSLAGWNGVASATGALLALAVLVRDYRLSSS